MEEFSIRLKEAIKKTGISIRDLSKKSGVHEHTIYSYITPDKYGHNRNPRMLNMEALCETLGISMDWLCGQTNHATKMHIKRTILSEMICKLRNADNIAQVSAQTPKTSRRIIHELIKKYEMDELADISDDFILGFIYASQITDKIICEERDSVKLPFS